MVVCSALGEQNFIDNLRLAHLAGTGSDRNLPGFVEVVVAVVLAWLMAGSAYETAKQIAAKAKVNLICNMRKRKTRKKREKTKSKWKLA